MRTFEDFGKWVAKMGGQEGLALAYEKELGKSLSQSAISGWFKSRRIPEARRADLKALGWSGPYEWPQEAAAGGPAPYVTREEFGELVGRLKRLEEDYRALLPLALAAKDLDARVRKLAGDQEPAG